MQLIVSINPDRCRMWSLHDRLDHEINEASCRVEMESFAQYGQLVPVLGRRLHGDATHDVELVYGARRLFVARRLGRPLKVELRELSDREALVAMDIENRQRRDISPYERGLSYARWLRIGLFRTQDDMAEALHVSSSQVSRLLKLAHLPSVVIAAFASPLEICESWGLDLAAALEDPQRRPLVLRAARSMHGKSSRLPGREVYRQLLAGAARGRKLTSRARDEVVKSASGDPLFRIRLQTQSVSLLLPVERVPAQVLERIRAAVAGVLQHATSQTADSTDEAA